MKVCREFRFEAGHYLPNYAGKCREQHGHTWYLKVKVEGPVSDSGFVVDFTLLRSLVGLKILDKLDHTNLNDLGLSFSDNPTCERIVDWIWRELADTFKPARLVSVKLYESPESYAELTKAKNASYYIGELERS